MSFLLRLFILISLMAVVALGDWWRHGSDATRWREYGFLLFSGAVMGLLAVSVDQCSGRYSPEYFTLGKGIAQDEDFIWNVAMLGGHAGLGGGLISGGLYLLANNPRKNQRPPLKYSHLTSLILFPMGMALLAIPILAPFLFFLDPFELRSGMSDLLAADAARRFLAVWSTNAALYAGSAIGTLVGVTMILRLRKIG